MRIVRNLLITPVGVSVVAVHWIVVAFAMLGDSPEPGFGTSTYLTLYLYLLNLPAIMTTSFIVKPIVYLSGLDAGSGSLFAVVMIMCVTLQWLLYGKLIQCIIDESTKGEKLSRGITII